MRSALDVSYMHFDYKQRKFARFNLAEWSTFWTLMKPFFRAACDNFFFFP